jgi:hypothetical protein
MIFNMPTSYDGTLLDHLAEHIMYLSTSSSFWFSVNSSYEHGCHLSIQMIMSPPDYEYRLVEANLLNQNIEVETLLQGASVCDNQLYGHSVS